MGRFLTTGTGARGAPSGTGTAAAFDVYTRTNGTGSVTELYLIGGTGGEIQLTNVGKIKAESIGGVYPAINVAALATIMNLIYPIGIVITLGVATNPATLLGIGTWTAIAGKVIVGINAGDAEFDTLDETGGAKTHTLLTAEMPAHIHSIPQYFPDPIGGGSGSDLRRGVTAGYNTGSTGGGGAHNNLQPYIVKYVWQRTA